MSERTARCACGQVTVRCTGEPVSVSLCNCTECQRRTGSAFGVAAFFRAEDVEARGETGCFSRVADSGFAVHHHFCTGCGTTIWWLPERKADMIAVALGCFADPGFPAPSKSVHEETKVPWVDFRFD